MQTNAHQTARAHCDGAPVHYERHRPEQTTLYRLVQQHAQSFFAQSEEAAGARLPQFVRDEFDAFLECGILAHGFLRLRCGDCGHDKLLAFSCKRRGFCPSCGARRMSQTAAHLVDHVIPHVPVRQWVLSLPIPAIAMTYRGTPPPYEHALAGSAPCRLPLPAPQQNCISSRPFIARSDPISCGGSQRAGAWLTKCGTASLTQSIFGSDADNTLSPSPAPGHTNQVLNNSLIPGCVSEPTRVATLSTDDRILTDTAGPTPA